MWVATTLTRMLYTDDDNRLMFFKLFGYISGNNSAGMYLITGTKRQRENDAPSTATLHIGWLIKSPFVH